MIRRLGRGRDGRVALPAVRRARRLFASVVAALFLPGCGPEVGPGSVHVDPARTSGLMVLPERKVHSPATLKGRGPRTTPKSSRSRR